MKKENNLKEWITPLTVAHFLLVVFIGLTIFVKAEHHSDILGKLGSVLIICALVFWFVPMFTLRKYGEVSPFGSFLATTRLVDRGVYGLIRHPQYLGFMILTSGIALLYQQVYLGVLAVMIIVLLRFGMNEEDKLLRAQFGEEFINYCKRVPSVNIFKSLITILKEK
ncbi:MAG TPA: isoprenylcysteine carboxylmethyltransferase family protein [Prolixibacteraceae bacterium]|nr:isoprenylcysteine carboxylmethyltransferase family protein [Prolixibacteraceae bacterium]